MAIVRILIEHEGDLYTGQCLEHDLCVQGKDLDDVRRRILIQMEVLSKMLDGLDGISPAPQSFHDVWESGEEPPLRMKLKFNQHEVDAEFRMAAAA